MAVGSGREGTTEDYGKEGLEYIKNDYRVWKRGLTGNFHQLKIYTLWSVFLDGAKGGINFWCG